MLEDEGMTWAEWFQKNLDTLGVSLAFTFAGAGFLVWTSDDKAPLTRKQTIVVIGAGLLVDGVATAFVQGYLGWSPFLAPLVGAVSGLTGLPVIVAVARRGPSAGTLIDAMLERLTGKKGGA